MEGFSASLACSSAKLFLGKPPGRIVAVSILLVFSFSVKVPAQCFSTSRWADTSIVRASVSQFKLRSLLLPFTLIATGVQGVNSHLFVSNAEMEEERDEYFPHFHTNIDNYLQFAPMLAGFALLDERNHPFWPYTEKVLVTEGLMMAMVIPAKHYFGVKRPDSDARNSFPSGHTAQAFAGATVFCDEFAKEKPWLQVTVYAGASAVGMLRVLNNRHWAGDVLAGAGAGILSAKLAERLLVPRHKHHVSLN